MGIFRDKYGDIKPYVKVLAAAACTAAIIGGCQVGHTALSNVKYSSGSRVGVINKVSQKGLFWKSYEGQMALEGLVGSENTSANVWDFSIDAQAKHGENIEGLAKSINDALNSGQKVKIDYIQSANVIFPFYQRGKTDYYIQGVEPLAKSEKK